MKSELNSLEHRPCENFVWVQHQPQIVVVEFTSGSTIKSTSSGVCSDAIFSGICFYNLLLTCARPNSDPSSMLKTMHPSWLFRSQGCSKKSFALFIIFLVRKRCCTEVEERERKRDEHCDAKFTGIVSKCIGMWLNLESCTFLVKMKRRVRCLTFCFQFVRWDNELKHLNFLMAFNEKLLMTWSTRTRVFVYLVATESRGVWWSYEMCFRSSPGEMLCLQVFSFDSFLGMLPSEILLRFVESSKAVNWISEVLSVGPLIATTFFSTLSKSSFLLLVIVLCFTLFEIRNCFHLSSLNCRFLMKFILVFYSFQSAFQL